MILFFLVLISALTAMPGYTCNSRLSVVCSFSSSNETITRYAPAYRALEHRDFDRVYPLIMGYIRDRFLLTKARKNMETGRESG